VPSIVDPLEYSVADMPGKAILGFIGRIDRGKGLHVVLHALEMLGGDVTLRVAGEGPAYKDDRRLAKELDVLDRVEFLGKIPLEEVPAFYASVDLTVLPFTRVEALPRSVLESMACGRPVLISDICGGSENIIEGETGFVVPHGDAKAVADKVGDVIRDKGLLLRMGGECRRYIEGHHAPKIILKKVEGFYRKVIRDRAG
jgi:glycosyltransferase involved in cell wall biosynthesis